MHDFMLAKEIADKVKEVAKENNLEKISQVVLELGTVSLAHDGFEEHEEDISVDNLKFGLEEILKQEKATKIIGFGNYISIPVILAAKFLRIPYYLQEQNSIMGLANRKFYKGSAKVFLAFRNNFFHD